MEDNKIPEDIQQLAREYAKNAGLYEDIKYKREAYIAGAMDERQRQYDKANEIVADIRNKLGSFWNLVMLVKNGMNGYDIMKEANTAYDHEMYILDRLEELRNGK